MSSMSSDLKTQVLAKRLAQSTNQKCNFKYLMNSKTSRSFKNAYPSKQNQIESVIMNSAHKLANKTANFAKYDSQIMDNQKMPLCLHNENLTQRETQPSCNLNSSVEFKSKEIIQSSPDLELQSKLKTDVSQIGSESVACMTEDCYYEKELLIKMELLKKQRDEIWNSISDIVKQNLTLKQIIAKFTIDSKITQTACTQTQFSLTSEIQIQTELEGTEIDEEYQIYLKSKKELQQAQSFCLKMLPKEETFNYSNNVGLKNLLLETLNLTLINQFRQFQKQKEFLVTLKTQQIEQWKNTVDKLKSQIEKCNQKLQESIRLKDNIKKNYQKEIQELKSLVQQKQFHFINQILQIKQDWQDIIKNHEIKNKFYLQYFENTKDCFKEKQTLYSTLLSQSHKTINNLMGQMKQFQVMANNNYYKHLRNQRSQQNLEKFLKPLE